MARPELEIDGKLVEKPSAQVQARFAEDFLKEISGYKELPKFVNPVKVLRRIVRSMPKDQRDWFKGSIYDPQTYSTLTLEKKFRTAMYTWTRGAREYDGQCPYEFSGFTWIQFKEHIENRFEPWMNWENWGMWQVDHIIPRSRYLKPFTKNEIFGLNNLRPLCKHKNMAKGNRL